MSNHPRTERESRLKAMNAMRLPRFEAMSGCRFPDVSGAEPAQRMSAEIRSGMSESTAKPGAVKRPCWIQALLSCDVL